MPNQSEEGAKFKNHCEEEWNVFRTLWTRTSNFSVVGFGGMGQGCQISGWGIRGAQHRSDGQTGGLEWA